MFESHVYTHNVADVCFAFNLTITSTSWSMYILWN